MVVERLPHAVPAAKLLSWHPGRVAGAERVETTGTDRHLKRGAGAGDHVAGLSNAELPRPGVRRVDVDILPAIIDQC